MKKKLSIFLLSIVLVGVLFNRPIISYGAEMESQVGLTFTEGTPTDTGTDNWSWSNTQNEPSRKNSSNQNTGRKLPVTGEDMIFFLPYIGLLLLLVWLIVIGKKHKGEKRR